MKNNTEGDFQILDDREHLLRRPSMYIGSINFEEQNDFNFDEDKMKYENFKIIPGLCKIINEVIDNAIDEAIKTDFKFSTEINIEISEDKVKVQDNGRGIPIVKHGEYYQPFLCWGRAKAGSNFNDENHTQIGNFGVGSYCSNVWSKKFIGETDDGKNSYKVIFKDNASESTESLGKSVQHGTTVTFYPDLKRFNITEIDEVHINYIYQRVLCLANIFDKIKFKFNKKLIKTKNFKDFIKLFNENFEIYENENVKIALIPNDSDDFKQFSYVNGLKIKDGGTHVDCIMKNVVNIIRDKISKKYKNIKPGDIRNKLTLIAFIKNFPSPKFNSQTKEKLTNSDSEFNNFAEIDYSFVNKILKNNAFIDPIIEIYKIKEEYENRKALKSVEKVKKIKSERYIRGVGDSKYLILTEGLCLEENTKVFEFSNRKNKKIKNLKIGDLVLTHNQNIKPISNKTFKITECVKIKTKIGEITASAEHRFFVFDKIQNEFVWKKTKDINTESDFLLKNRLDKNMIFINFTKEKTSDAKYCYHLKGQDFEYFSSKDHKFMVFDKKNFSFKLLECENLDENDHTMVLIKD